MKHFKLLIIAILGSITGYVVINNFIVSIGIGQYICIELLLTILHSLYNVARNREQVA